MKKRFRMILAGLLVGLVLIQTVPHSTRATANPTAIGLTEFVLKAWRQGWGYVYGTYGQLATQSLIDSKARQYPSVFAEKKSDGRTVYAHAQEWIGVRAADCVGLAKAYLWWVDDRVGPQYSSATDYSANGLYYRASVKGPMATIPATHGVMVWRDGHVGIYIGNDEVIESRGVEYGVVRTRLSDRNWTGWFLHPNLTYNAQGWTQIDGKTFYYRSGKYLTGQQVIDGQVCLFGQDGARLTGFQPVNGQLSYFTADGSVLSGWQTIDGNRYYLDEAARPLTGRQTLDGKTYYFSSVGTLLTGWQSDEGQVLYLDDQGLALAGAVTVDGRTVLLDRYGHLARGWVEETEGWRWYTPGGDAAPSGLLQTADGAYWLDAQGLRQTGWQLVGQREAWFDPQTGQRASAIFVTPDPAQADQEICLLADGTRADSGKPILAGGQWQLCDAQGVLHKADTELAAVAAGGESTTILLAIGGEPRGLQLTNQDTFTVSLSADMTDLPAGTAIQATLDGSVPTEGTWITFDPAVAAIDDTGRITAAAPGQTLVGFVSGSQYALAGLTVLPDPASLTAPAEPVRLAPGCGLDFPVAGLLPSLRAFYTLRSSDPEKVAVRTDGGLAAIGPGQADITLLRGETEILTFGATVAWPAIGLSADRDILHLAVGESRQAPVNVLPQGALASIAYSSSQPLVASVDENGQIKGLATGEATVTAQAGTLVRTLRVEVSGTLPTLGRGTSGEAVLRMEEKLAQLGYLPEVPDSQMGSLDEFAVRCLQVRLNLTPSGQADHALQQILYDGAAPAATPVQVAGSLRAGDQGEQVKVLQMRLFDLHVQKIPPDGTWGAHTTQAMTTLQLQNGLEPNGVAGVAEIRLVFSAGVTPGRDALQLEDTGHEVVLLQERLKSLGYYGGPIDGRFSEAVETAVSQFQVRCGLTDDGVAGPTTQQRLYRADAPVAPGSTPGPVTPVPTATPAPVPSDGTIARGSPGELVAALEDRLVALGYHYALPDALFDDLTDVSVRNFQVRSALPVTGIADLETQKRLSRPLRPAQRSRTVMAAAATMCAGFSSA